MATGTPHDTAAGGEVWPPAIPPAGPAPPGGGWTAGRIIAVVIGSVLVLVSLGLLGGGGTLMWADQSLRQDGFLTTGTNTYATGGYALASERIGLGGGWLLTGLIGDVRVRVTAAGQARPVFVAIGPADAVSAYLSGTSYATVTSASQGAVERHYGTAVPAPPRTAGIWTAQVAGTGTQTLRWTAQTGDWMIVAMNPDGAPGLAVRADVGVSVLSLYRLSVELIVGGIFVGLLAAALIIVPVRLAARTR